MATAKKGAAKDKADKETANETAKKTVRPAKDAKKGAEKKENKKDAILKDFEILTGIPDSEYFNFENKALNSLLSAMYGTPGIMRGKIIEIAGKSDVGKTALATTLTAAAQRQGVKGFHVDVEKSLNREFATLVGLDTKKLLLVRPDNGEAAMMGLRKVVRDMGGMFGVLDSSSACLPKAETEDKGGGMGAKARMMSEEMAKVDKIIAKSGANLVIISQIKTKPGVTFGNPEYVSSGGSAVGFYSRIRQIVSKVEVLKDEATKQETGYTVRSVITKNHTGPKRTTPFDLVVDNLFRIDYTKTALAWAKQFKLIDADSHMIAGSIEYSGSTDKEKLKVLAGKEHVVFEAVDAIFKKKEGGTAVAYEDQADSTEELVGTDEVNEEDFDNVIDVNAGDAEDDGDV